MHSLLFYYIAVDLQHIPHLLLSAPTIQYHVTAKIAIFCNYTVLSSWESILTRISKTKRNVGDRI